MLLPSACSHHHKPASGTAKKQSQPTFSEHCSAIPASLSSGSNAMSSGHCVLHRRMPLLAAPLRLPAFHLHASLTTTSEPGSAPSAQPWTWTGRDEYSDLGDRVDATPLPLPPISVPVRITIVRHGQSTWNAETRVQGSSNLSSLTDKGKDQAAASRALISGRVFDRLYVSPLRRAVETADILWSGRPEIPRLQPAVLREIDLYSFQGLTKAEVRATYPSQYQDWHQHPERFTIDGHAPVREMWHRGSLAWRTILEPETVGSETSSNSDTGPLSRPVELLVVAHNNTNQALLAAALGLPCTYFRRLLQSNAALSSLLLQPGAAPGAEPEVTLECLNQSPGPRLKLDAKAAARVLLMCKTELPEAQEAAAALMAKMQVHAVLCGPYQPAQRTARAVVAAQLQAGHACPDVNTLMDAGSALASNEVWHSILSYAQASTPAAPGPGPGPTTVLVITDACATAALLCQALGLDAERIAAFKVSPGSVSVLEFPSSPGTAAAAPCTAACINSTAHLVPPPQQQQA